MSAKPRDLGMTPLDDLFSTDESHAEAQLEKVVTLNPADISDFPNHPFKVKQDEAMAEMVDSVKQYGVLVPAVVRPKADGGYEMVAGHRRKCAATLAGITEMPCIVRNLTDDEATIIMVDSNLQRETILPSEKAFAYKMKLEAMKRQGQRSDLTSTPLEPKLKGSRSNEELAASSPDSRSQIQRYIRLTELIPPVLDMVDSGKIAFRPAVELSYLSKEQQQSLYDTMECEDCTPSLAQAIKMKEFSRDGKLTVEEAAAFDFGATLRYNEKPVADQSSVKCLYTGITSNWQSYSCPTTPPTEPGRYVMTVVTLGGNYQAAPITRSFQITK